MEGSIKIIFDFLWKILTNFWPYMGFVLIIFIIRGDVNRGMGHINKFIGGVFTRFKQINLASKFSKVKKHE